MLPVSALYTLEAQWDTFSKPVVLLYYFQCWQVTPTRLMTLDHINNQVDYQVQWVFPHLLALFCQYVCLLSCPLNYPYCWRAAQIIQHEELLPPRWDINLFHSNQLVDVTWNGCTVFTSSTSVLCIKCHLIKQANSSDLLFTVLKMFEQTLFFIRCRTKTTGIFAQMVFFADSAKWNILCVLVL